MVVVVVGAGWWYFLKCIAETWCTVKQKIENILSMEIMELGIFPTHKVIPCTFPSLLKVALGKQGIYLLLRIVITRNLSLKHSKFPCFLVFFANFNLFTWIFCK